MEKLIDVINRMKSVTIYVHNMETSMEVEVWDKTLYCPHVFKDSSEAKNLPPLFFGAGIERKK